MPLEIIEAIEMHGSCITYLVLPCNTTINYLVLLCKCNATTYSVFMNELFNISLQIQGDLFSTCLQLECDLFNTSLQQRID